MEYGKYRVILADPPWNHVNSLNHRKGRVNTADRRHYGTLGVGAICRLPISELADKNAVLFMWACAPLLAEAFDVMRSWGFTYRTTAFTWVKLNRDGSPFLGMGQYTRQNSELCLMGVRGSVPRKARNISQIILSRRREHSRKPDEQYDRIMRLFDGPYLELFARQQWPGWDVWGNEAGKFPAQPFLFGEEGAA